MLGLLANILPFAAGASISPTILVLQLRYCGGPDGSRATGAIFAAGGAVVLVVVTGLALALAAGTGGAESSPTDVGVVKLVLALVLVIYGASSLRARPRSESDSGAASGEPPLRTFVVGIAMMATNLSSLALFFPAVHEIGVARAELLGKAVAFVLLFTATMLPALVPLLPAGPAGRALQARTKRVHDLFAAHERTLMPAATFLFAAYLAVQGVVRLV